MSGEENGHSSGGTERTTVSDVIESLEKIREERGDLPVLISREPGDSVAIGVKEYSHPPGTSAVIGLCYDGTDTGRKEDR